MYQYFKSNRRKTAGDCAVRALMVVTGWDWYRAYDALCEEGRKKMDMPNSTEAIESLLLKEGFQKMKVVVEKGSKRPTVNQLAQKHPNHKVLVVVAGHFVGCKNGDYFDAWDSGSSSAYCYFIKPI